MIATPQGMAQVDACEPSGERNDTSRPRVLDVGGRADRASTTLDTARVQPQVVVIPAHQSTARTVRWLRDVGARADLLMSVCTGAFVLAETGLLDGKTATTHHQFYDDFESAYPGVDLVRGRRFVEHEGVATAGGLTSGIDLALRVVERYLGPDAAVATARYLEYGRPIR